jgi:hypothetical protein
MPFARVSLDLPTHHKIMAAGVQGPAVLGWQTAAICFSNLHLTDGVLRRSQLAGLLPGAGPPDEQVLNLLLELRLWDEVSPGVWRIHDFCDENLSREEREAKREADAERKRASYRRKRKSPKISEAASGILHSEKKSLHSEKNSSPNQRRRIEEEKETPPLKPPTAALAEATRSERSLSLVQNQDSPDAVLNQDGQEDPMHPWEARAAAVSALLAHREAAPPNHNPDACPDCLAASTAFEAATSKSGYLSPQAAAYLHNCRARLLAQRGADNGTNPTQIPGLEP